MGLTVNQLHKITTKLLAEGHGRKPVCVSKNSYSHNCEEDGITILPVEDVMLQAIYLDDGDGGTKVNADGREATRATVVLYGWGFDPDPKKDGYGKRYTK